VDAAAVGDSAGAEAAGLGDAEGVVEADAVDPEPPGPPPLDARPGSPPPHPPVPSARIAAKATAALDGRLAWRRLG
jgi:hypothetical protein